MDVVSGLLSPQGVSAESAGGGPSIAYVADTANSQIVTPNGRGGLTSIAGDPNHAAYRGDGGLATRAWLSQPFDVSGPYIADTTNQRIRYIDPVSGVINTLAGNGTQGYGGDGGAAKDAGTGTGSAVAYDAKLTGLETPISRASALTVDEAGNVYFPVFWGDEGTTIMRLAPDGTMSKVIGGGTNPEPGVDPLQFALPDVLGLGFDLEGALLICGSDGTVYRLAGVASPGG